MFNYTQEERMQSLDALSAAVHQSPDLPRQKLEETVDEHIVVISVEFDTPFHSNARGFRITSDGFIVTAYHLIAPALHEWEKINFSSYDSFSKWRAAHRGKHFVVKDSIYTIDTTTFSYDEESDIALIKAVIAPYFSNGDAGLLRSVNGKTPKPVAFRIMQGELKIGDRVRLHDGLDKKNRGRVLMEAGNVRKDYFVSNVYGRPGFSGAVMTHNGEAAGILHGGLSEKDAIEIMGEQNVSVGVRAQKITELVERAVEKWRTEYQ